MFFRKLRALLTPPIGNTMLLEDLLHCSGLATEPTGFDDLVIGIFWIKAYVTDKESFFGIGI